MRVAVFTGPTLSRAEVFETIADAECFGPAAQGDLYRAALRNPVALGLIDGYFKRLPSVWHKEILWAMSRGIHVFGASSMGALRAAELEPFGMIGVGKIFEAFRDGVLEDDDEVAIAHGPTADSYQFGSEPMVNIRATLARALAEGVAPHSTIDALLAIAKRLLYGERCWDRILSLAGEQGPADLDRLRAWLPGSAVNQKREDAVAMLRTIRDFLETAPGPKKVSYVFEETLYWREFVESGSDPDALEGPDRAVLEALRRDPAAWERAEAAALGWWLAEEQAGREGHRPAAAVLLGLAEEFCRRNGIRDQAGVTAWLERNHASRADLDRCLEREALARRACATAPAALTRCVLDYLRRTGEYALLLATPKKP